jgi:hypothetical protein
MYLIGRAVRASRRTEKKEKKKARRERGRKGSGKEEKTSYRAAVPFVTRLRVRLKNIILRVIS